MTAPTLGRPLQPTHRRMFAQFLAGLDPRCDFPQHDIIQGGGVCAFCHRSLMTYLTMVPTVWHD